MSNGASDINDINEMMGSRISALRDDDGEASYPYIIFELADTKFAVNCKYVLSIEPTPETETLNIMESSRNVIETFDYKGEPVDIFDLRKLFGYMSQSDYIKNVVNIPQRIKDHVTFAQTLKDCVSSGEPFTLNTDPRKCAFGQWFYSYGADIEVKSFAEIIEPVHDKFHHAAQEVKILLSLGRTNEASGILDEIKELEKNIVQKLNRLNEIMMKSITELNIILQVKEKKVGIIADNAESFEYLDEIQELPLSLITTKYIKRLGLSKKDGTIIFILDAEEFAD